MYRVIIVSLLFLLSSCSSMEITPTMNASYSETEPSDVQILLTVPRNREYTEMAAVTAADYDHNDVEDLHDDLQEKGASVGAHAVIILNQRINVDDKMWATGVCIRWND